MCAARSGRSQRLALARDLEESGASTIARPRSRPTNPRGAPLPTASTKAPLTNHVVNLAQELGLRGIRVNAVAPGPVWTPLIPATMSRDKVEGFGSDTPLGRVGQPVEVAAAYVFLASDEAIYLSGTVPGLTGGKPVL